MALSNKSPLGSISDIVAQLKESRGIPTSSFGDELDADYVAPQLIIKRDFWQEGLNDEYQRAADLQDLINLGKQ